MALEAFSYLYRVPIPRVKVPAGRDDGDAPTSGSGALRWGPEMDRVAVSRFWVDRRPIARVFVNR